MERKIAAFIVLHIPLAKVDATGKANWFNQVFLFFLPCAHSISCSLESKFVLESALMYSLPIHALPNNDLNAPFSASPWWLSESKHVFATQCKHCTPIKSRSFQCYVTWLLWFGLKRYLTSIFRFLSFCLKLIAAELGYNSRQPKWLHISVYQLDWHA